MYSLRILAEEILKETISALKIATETLTTMTSFVGSVMQQRNNVTQSSNPTGASISASNERSSYNLASAMLATYNYRQETTANVEQTFHRHLDKTGIIYAEDLPKMDYLSPTIRKQILEKFPSCSSNSRGKGDTCSPFHKNS